MARSSLIPVALVSGLVSGLVVHLYYQSAADKRESAKCPPGESFQCASPAAPSTDNLLRQNQDLLDRLRLIESQRNSSEIELIEPVNIDRGNGDRPDDPEPLEADYFASEFPELWISDSALRDLGLADYQVEEITAAYHAYELAKSDARRHAESSGLGTSSRLTAELRRLRDNYKAEIGDENYDRVLYASGEMNRLKVGDVLQGSAGEHLGLQAGDIIYQYAGERVFDPSTFYLLAKDHGPSVSIELVVMRSGQLVHMLAPGGELGARINHIRVLP